MTSIIRPQCDVKREDGVKCLDDIDHYGRHTWPDARPQSRLYEEVLSLRSEVISLRLQIQMLVNRSHPTRGPGRKVGSP